MEELLALRPVSVWASQAMLCESVCGVSSAVFLVHYFFMLALTLMLREWKRRYACVLSSLSALCHLMGVFGIMYKIFFMFWSVFAYLQECISTHTHTHTHTHRRPAAWDSKNQIVVLLHSAFGGSNWDYTLTHIWVCLTRAEDLLKSSVWVFGREMFPSSPMSSYSQCNALIWRFLDYFPHY